MGIHLGKYNPMEISNLWDKSVGDKNVWKWEPNIP
jgi:hypothetical protein